MLTHQDIHNGFIMTAMDKCAPLRAGDEQITLDPMLVLDSPYIIYPNEKIPKAHVGYWILQVKAYQLNREWQKSVYLYKSGKLPGVTSMWCFTNHDSSMLDVYAYKTIRFYCANPQDIMNIGHMIRDHMVRDYPMIKYGKPLIYFGDDHVMYIL